MLRLQAHCLDTRSATKRLVASSPNSKSGNGLVIFSITDSGRLLLER
jgi:hypothetical protein